MKLRVPANPGMKKAKIVIFVGLNLLLNVTMHMCIYIFKIDASCQRAEFSILQLNFLSRYSFRAAAEATPWPALFYFF